MNHEVEREEGELAKLRLFRERVMALPRYTMSLAVSGVSNHGGYQSGVGDWIRAADIDEALKEAGSE